MLVRQQQLKTHASPTAAAVRHAVTQLRDYQEKAVFDIESAWPTHQNVLFVLPTGGGKTVVLSHIVHRNAGASVVMAHRRELISQISIALARNGIVHRLVAPPNVIKQIIKLHVKELGVSYYSASAPTGVASVDSLDAQLKKQNAADLNWANSITLWIQDEAHHVLRDNKWGRAIERFPNARGLGVTATPCRADGKGLGRHASGVFDILIEGPTMRWLINQGFLTDYRIACPPNALDMSDVAVGKEGDYTRAGAAKAVKRAKITGDIVAHYLRLPPGLRGVTFVPDVDSASDTAVKFKQAGVPAEALSAKSKESIRVHAVERLKSGELLQLVNVDLFGEGFDLPAINVVSFGRPTLSFSLYAQQFGRGLRPVYATGYDLSTREGRLAAIANGPKPVAHIFDHVGNVIAHGGPPDRPMKWTLDDREKRSKSAPNDAVPITRCLNPLCMAPYEKFEPKCPYCGEAKPAPARRDGPEFVDGDLIELDAATLAKMRGEAIDVDETPDDIRRRAIAKRVPGVGQEAAVANGQNDQIAQRQLRAIMQRWSGWQMANGLDSDSKRYQKFYWTFGTDALTAQSLKRKDAEQLKHKILEHMGVAEDDLK